jgi:hypothetical protein
MKKNFSVVAVALAVFMLCRPTAGKAYLMVGYSPEKTCFTVSYRGEESSYNVTPLFVLPGEDVSIAITTNDSEAQFAMLHRLGALVVSNTLWLIVNGLVAAGVVLYR